MHERRRGLFQAATGIEFEFAVKLVATGKDVRARQTAECQLRAVRSAADRLRERIESSTAGGLEDVLRKLGMVLQHFFHVPVVLFDIDTYEDAGKPVRRLAALRQPIDGYFDAVMVMCENAALRGNRLALLARLYNRFRTIADISELATG